MSITEKYKIPEGGRACTDEELQQTFTPEIYRQFITHKHRNQDNMAGSQHSTMRCCYGCGEISNPAGDETGENEINSPSEPTIAPKVLCCPLPSPP